MNPTNEHREQAREPERIWIDADEVGRAIRNGVGSYYTRPAPNDTSNREVEYVPAASALSSHDTEVREALESLALWQLSGEIHWCDPRLPCTEQCQRIQGLYEKVQPKEPSGVTEPDR